MDETSIAVLRARERCGFERAHDSDVITQRTAFDAVGRRHQRAARPAPFHFGQRHDAHDDAVALSRQKARFNPRQRRIHAAPLAQMEETPCAVARTKVIPVRVRIIFQKLDRKLTRHRACTQR